MASYLAIVSICLWYLPYLNTHTHLTSGWPWPRQESVEEVGEGCSHWLVLRHRGSTDSPDRSRLNYQWKSQMQMKLGMCQNTKLSGQNTTKILIPSTGLLTDLKIMGLNIEVE